MLNVILIFSVWTFCSSSALYVPDIPELPLRIFSSLYRLGFTSVLLYNPLIRFLLKPEKRQIVVIAMEGVKFERDKITYIKHK
jgi:hypothetical protein